jgi:hypothetical protein
MAFKQGNNPISRKTSPMRMSPFTKQEPSMSMDELEKMSAAQDAASKAQAQQLPQIEGPGSPDYEAKTTMTYPGGEEGADYDEEGTQDGMSRIASPLNAGPDDMEGIDSGEEAKSEEKKPGNSRAEIKARKSKQKSEGVSGSKRRANKAKSKSEAAAEKAKTAKNPDYKKQLEAKSERLAKRSKRKEGRAKIKERNKETRKANKETRKS